MSKALTILENAHGKYHPSRANTMDQYAIVLRTQKKDELAQRVEERAKEIRDKCAQVAANPQAFVTENPDDQYLDQLPWNKRL